VFEGFLLPWIINNARGIGHRILTVVSGIGGS